MMAQFWLLAKQRSWEAGVARYIPNSGECSVTADQHFGSSDFPSTVQRPDASFFSPFHLDLLVWTWITSATGKTEPQTHRTF